MTRYDITIDDADRADEPERPWTANAQDEDGDHIAECGIGATPREALLDLIANIAEEAPEFGEHMEPGDWVEHLSGTLDPREVAEVNGSMIRLRLGRDFITEPMPRTNYTVVRRRAQEAEAGLCTVTGGQHKPWIGPSSTWCLACEHAEAVADGYTGERQ